MNQPSLKLRRSGMSMLRSKKVRGAALMLSLWALFLLSAMIVSWALDIDSRLTLSGNANRLLEAEAMACSGAEVALHPSIKPGSPNLSGGLGGGKSYEARITGEGGRLDLNWHTSAAADPGVVEVLRRYLENKGIDLNERDGMVDALLDWVEPGAGLHRLNAPPDSDTYHPAHAPLTRVDELKQVAGWAEFTSAPGWDDDFTVNTRTGVDLAWASRDVLLALPGMTAQIVDRFLELRRGPDGIDGTEDDVIKTEEQARAALGLKDDQFLALKQLGVSFKGVQIFRVVSVGKAGDATRVVQMVFRRVGFASQMITWKEF
jgi:general secretion pathway protein K